MLMNIKAIFAYSILLGVTHELSAANSISVEQYYREKQNRLKAVGFEATHDFGNADFYIDSGIRKVSGSDYIDLDKIGEIRFPAQSTIFSSRKGVLENRDALKNKNSDETGQIDFLPPDQTNGDFGRVNYIGKNKKSLYPENAEVSAIWRDLIGNKEYDGITSYSIRGGKVSQLMQCNAKGGFCSLASTKICAEVMAHAKKITKKSTITIEEILSASRLCNAVNTWNPSADFVKEVRAISEQFLSNAENLAKSKLTGEGEKIVKEPFELRKPKNPHGFLTSPEGPSKETTFSYTKNWMDTLGMCASFIDQEPETVSRETSRKSPTGQAENSP